MISIKIEGEFKVPTQSALERLRKQMRDGIVKYIHEYTRARVLNLSEGAGNLPLPGYSTHPVTVQYPGSPKRKVKPTGGTKTKHGMHFEEGYKEYREKAGLVSDRFVFFNTGDAWRDWKVLTFGDPVSEIGFSDPNNAMAAAKSEESRPGLFKISEYELMQVDTTILELINNTFFS